jgi:capsular polysaccharide biosynthesis protein
MNPENIFNSKNVKTILFITAIVVILGLVISLIQTPKYKSSAKLLVIFSQDNMNPYTSAQTSNYIAGILEEVVYSDSFINAVFKTNFDLENDLGFNQEEKMKSWQKMVKPRLQENKGIITIDVYHNDHEQANNFAQAISYTMITNHSVYHGSGDSVVVKMIGTPNASEKWDQPNIPQNLMLSLIAGVFISLTFIIIFPQQELVNFILGRKIVSRDETINFENFYQEDGEFQEENQDTENEHYF